MASGSPRASSNRRSTIALTIAQYSGPALARSPFQEGSSRASSAASGRGRSFHSISRYGTTRAARRAQCHPPDGLNQVSTSSSVAHGLAHSISSGDRLIWARNHQCTVWTLLIASSSASSGETWSRIAHRKSNLTRRIADSMRESPRCPCRQALIASSTARIACSTLSGSSLSNPTAGSMLLHCPRKRQIASWPLLSSTLPVEFS
jgi:hypothetical protein